MRAAERRRPPWQAVAADIEMTAFRRARSESVGDRSASISGNRRGQRRRLVRAASTRAIIAAAAGEVRAALMTPPHVMMGKVSVPDQMDPGAASSICAIRFHLLL
jgi:hypothetical protein